MINLVLPVLTAFFIAYMTIKIFVVIFRTLIRVMKVLGLFVFVLGGMDLYFESHLAATLFSSILKALHQAVLLFMA